MGPEFWLHFAGALQNLLHMPQLGVTRFTLTPHPRLAVATAAWQRWHISVPHTVCLCRPAKAFPLRLSAPL